MYFFVTRTFEQKRFEAISDSDWSNVQLRHYKFDSFCPNLLITNLEQLNGEIVMKMKLMSLKFQSIQYVQTNMNVC